MILVWNKKERRGVMSKQFLYEQYDILSSHNLFKKQLPSCIVDNLNPKFSMRGYQLEAFARFIYYVEQNPNKSFPIHLLFNMATGSGKTLMMAGLILYLYQKGQRNFIFFVNNTNIVDKTRLNFLDRQSSKYLFNPRGILIDSRQVELNEVGCFDYARNEAINICFTTIQGLHRDLTTIKENTVTYEDLQSRKLVLLADEGHHLNTATKKSSAKDRASWENTVSKIFGANRENYLLEFTATVDYTESGICQKYLDKIIYRYDLKDFRKDSYSKEIETLELGFNMRGVMLASLLVSQYRLKIAEKYGYHIKPVILFKAQKTKAQNNDNYQLLQKLLASLQKDEISKLEANKRKGTILDKVFGYFRENEISFHHIIRELKESFKVENTINVNDDKDLAKHQILLNTLEDKDNHIRAVFAVQKLNEGWDVLNLYDIVRLYEPRDGKWGKNGRYKAGKTTLSEVQLIGRGARYNPFVIQNKVEERFQRKFDKDIENPLRVLETLHYHSKYDVRYIAELRSALTDAGLQDEETVERPIKVREEIKDYAQKQLIFTNRREINTNEDKKKLSDFFDDLPVIKIDLPTYKTASKKLFWEEEDFSLEASDARTAIVHKKYFATLVSLEIKRHCMNKNRFFSFENLKKFFPYLKTQDEFIQSGDLLGKYKLEIHTSNWRMKNLSLEDKLKITDRVLADVQKRLQDNNSSFIGTKVFDKKRLLQDVFTDKVLRFSKGRDNEINLSDKLRGFFYYDKLYGTSQEQGFIKFFERFLEQLQQKYNHICLVRNERQVKLYNFSDGRGFEPDFVLFLQNDNKQSKVHYQVFIEPKGNQFLGNDGTFSTGKEGWKQNFLAELNQEIKLENLFENQEYKVVGLPFYNQEQERKFEEAIKEKLFF